MTKKHHVLVPTAATALFFGLILAIPAQNRRLTQVQPKGPDNPSATVTKPQGKRTHAHAKPDATGPIFTLFHGYDATPLRGLSDVAVGDFNGDGVPDMVVVNPCNIASSACPGNGTAGWVATLQGNGDGSFQAPVLYQTGTYYPDSVAVGDFNGDGHVDIAFSSQCPSFGNCATGAVSVMLGNGDGTFQAPVTYASGGALSYSVMTGDFNGDGILDFVVANQTGASGAGSSVSVMLGNGDGTFQAATSYASFGLAAISVAVGDFNGDGFSDVAVVNANNLTNIGSVAVMMGKGDGTLQPAVVYSTGGYQPNGVVAGDFNNDGVTDLAVVNACATGTSCSSGGSVGILLGNGDGSFQTAVTYASGGVTSLSLAAGDFDGDGNLDLAVTNQAPGSVTALLGNGDGTFQTAVSFGPGGTRSDSVMVADLNGDGQPDLLVTNQVSTDFPNLYSSVGVLLNSTSGYQFYGNSVAVTTSGMANPGDTVQLTATVTSPFNAGAPDGNVTFFDGGVALSTVPVSSGQAVLSTSFSVAGVHPIKALYTGATAYGPSTSPVVNQTIGHQTTLTSSQNPAPFGQGITFTVTIAGGKASGTVTFMDGVNPLGTANVTDGVATFSTSSLTPGQHAITVAYPGHGKCEPAGAALSQAVLQNANTSIASSAEVAVINQPVTYTATVTTQNGGTPSGVVVFMEGTVTLGMSPLVNGQATFSTSFSKSGVYAMTAIYLGDAADQGSTSAVESQGVAASVPVASTTHLTTSLSPTFFSQSVTFTATVTTNFGPIPDGELVTFLDAVTNVIGTGTTSGGVATLTLTNLPVGPHSVKAQYAGDASFKTSTSPIVSQVVNANPTTTTITADNSTIYIKQTVTFTATVSAVYGTIPDKEIITFKDAGNPIGTGVLSGGVATFTTSTLAAGTHFIRASYPGDGIYPLSSSLPYQEVVNLYTPTVTLVSSAATVPFGPPVVFTATVTSTAPTAPTGTVTFKIGTLVFATGALSPSGVTTITKTNFNPGAYAVTAQYNGDVVTAKTTSATVNEVVSQAATTTMLTSSVNASPQGAMVTFTAYVNSATGVPAGAVTFTINNNAVATVTLVNGKAVYTTLTAIPSGSNPVTATYNGALGFTGSTTSLTQTVY